MFRPVGTHGAVIGAAVLGGLVAGAIGVTVVSGGTPAAARGRARRPYRPDRTPNSSVCP